LSPFALNTFNVGLVGVTGDRFEKHTDVLNIQQRASVRDLEVAVIVGDLDYKKSGKFCRRLQDFSGLQTIKIWCRINYHLEPARKKGEGDRAGFVSRIKSSLGENVQILF
jgi:hypothetical protein